MAKTKSNRRPAPRPNAAANARRLGAANQSTPSAGAQRRAARAQGGRPNLVSWVAIGLVVAVVAGFFVYKYAGGSSKPSAASMSAGITSGQDPATASLTKMVNPVTTITPATYNSVGVDGQPVPFTVTKKQPVLKATGSSVPRFVYVGAEYCPYCAMVRWSLVSSLSRFGSFKHLKVTSSANDDGDIATFSFLGATYVSKYVDFTPYEYLDRNQSPLQSTPKAVSDLYAKYDGSQTTTDPATPFNPGQHAGIPFIDIANKYVGSGAPGFLNPVLTALYGGGPESTQTSSADAIAAALHDPTSPVGKAISANLLLALSNYFSAAICSVDGQQPSMVCTTSAVKAAAKSLAASTPVS